MPPYCSKEGCKAGELSKEQADITIRTLGNPFCPEHAAEESAKSAEAHTPPVLKLKRRLESMGFIEHKTKKGIMVKGEVPNVRLVDLNEKIPGIYLFDGTRKPVKEGENYGIIELDDVRLLVEALLPPSHVAEVPKAEPVKAEVIERPQKTPDAIVPVNTFTPQGNIIKGIIPSLKEIGKIKIGKKGDKTTQSGHRLPTKFDHFEITTIIRDEKTGDFLLDPIMQQLGEKPRELSIMLLYNDPTLNFSTWYRAYKGGKCLCSGNGVTAKNIAGETLPCNPDTCEVFQNKGCKPNGILQVILTDAPRLGGVYKFRTTSYNSIRSILSSLFFLSSLTGGVLAMIPLKLTVSPMQVQPKDSDKMQTIYVVNVEFAGTAQKLLETVIEVAKYQGSMRAQIQQLEATARLALDAPESEEEIKEIEAEWYPKKPEVAKS